MQDREKVAAVIAAQGEVLDFSEMSWEKSQQERAADEIYYDQLVNATASDAMYSDRSFEQDLALIAAAE